MQSSKKQADSKTVGLWIPLFVLAGVILISSCHGQEASDEVRAQADSVASQTGLTNSAHQIGVAKTVDDAQIRERIKRILDASTRVNNADVRVEEGIVFLQGQADDASVNDWATGIARNTEGVVAVVNNVELSKQIQFAGTLDQVRKSLAALWRDFLQRVPLILAGCLVLFLTWVSTKVCCSIVRRATVRARVRSSIRDLFLQLTTVSVWMAGLMIAAIIVFPGMTPAKILTVLGLSSVAIGFAFKDIFENFFAGVLILWRFPFDTGDFIRCGEISGRVEAITIRMCEIRRTDGQLVVVPNAMLFKQPVQVLTSQNARRASLTCGIAYGENINVARDVMKKAVSECATVLSDHPVDVLAAELDSSSVNFEITWWTGSSPLETRKSRDEVLTNVRNALHDAGIEIPYPHRTLVIDAPVRTKSEVELAATC